MRQNGLKLRQLQIQISSIKISIEKAILKELRQFPIQIFAIEIALEKVILKELTQFPIQISAKLRKKAILKELS